MTIQRVTKDNKNAISFYWNGKLLKGKKGDTLSAALLANNKLFIARSFKYHRPRGITSSGVEEGALVTLGKNASTEPNVNPSTTELYNNLEAFSQNAWPSLYFDFGYILNFLSKFFAAGFYYKMFIGIPPFEWGKGTSAWMFFEKYIRKIAGFGKASRQKDPSDYDNLNSFIDILVIGSGPSGINAALSASKAGFDVMLVEQDFELGGNYLNHQNKHKLNLLKEQLLKYHVKLKTRTTAFGIYDDKCVALVEKFDPSQMSKNKMRQRLHICRAKKIILATGAIERTYAFGNNDLPGIMTVNAGKSYLNRYKILVGKKIIISTNNDSVYETALELNNAGANVVILDARTQLSDSQNNLIKNSNIRLLLNTVVYRALGKKCVKLVETAKGKNNKWQKSIRINCDCLLISAGWSPVIHLAAPHSEKPVWSHEQACFLPGKNNQDIIFVGSAAGIWNTLNCEKSGNIVNENKLNQKSEKNSVLPLFQTPINNNKSKNFVDFQHDVTISDIKLAHQEGFTSVEHLKRYTTLGMASDQGKNGNIIGLAIMGSALNKEINEVGTSKFRPPYTPVTIGALASRNKDEGFKLMRRTPFHEWNKTKNCVMIETGLWQRPWFYPFESQKLEDASCNEVKITRKNVGICDVSTLGKIMLQGPDASIFLDNIYINSFSKLSVGKARYGIMLRDDGFILDDGTVWRISEDCYLITTTTNQAGIVMSWLEELSQVRWPDLQIHLTSVTDQWAGCAIAGPKSRRVIEQLAINKEEVSEENLPFMGVKKIKIETIECLIARISFSGELAYEVYIPSDFANSLIEKIWEEASNFNGCLYGSEALGTMRIEKGHVGGSELDGRVTVDDIQLNKMISKKKSFIGNTLRLREGLIKPGRPRLVGIFPIDKNSKFKSGGLLYTSEKISGYPIGWVTSATYSPMMGHYIGLGFIENGLDRSINEEIILIDKLKSIKIPVDIVSPQMYDPEGKKLNV